MKTLEDLVDGLNDVFSKEGHFYLFYDDEMETIYLFRKLTDVCFELAEISKKYKSWLVGKDLYMQVGEVQKVIMNFLVKSNSDDWFVEKKKYNIIIGRSNDIPQYLTTYRKFGTEGFTLDNATCSSDLSSNNYQLTENEIEELKSTLPENMAKIVELGKVEVKHD